MERRRDALCGYSSSLRRDYVSDLGATRDTASAAHDSRVRARPRADPGAWALGRSKPLPLRGPDWAGHLALCFSRLGRRAGTGRRSGRHQPLRARQALNLRLDGTRYSRWPTDRRGLGALGSSRCSSTVAGATSISLRPVCREWSRNSSNARCSSMAGLRLLSNPLNPDRSEVAPAPRAEEQRQRGVDYSGRVLGQPRKGR
jgi:hypothetical protein